VEEGKVTPTYFPEIKLDGRTVGFLDPNEYVKIADMYRVCFQTRRSRSLRRRPAFESNEGLKGKLNLSAEQLCEYVGQLRYLSYELPLPKELPDIKPLAEADWDQELQAAPAVRRRPGRRRSLGVGTSPRFAGVESGFFDDLVDDLKEEKPTLDQQGFFSMLVGAALDAGSAVVELGSAMVMNASSRRNTATNCLVDGCSNTHRYADGFCHEHRQHAQ
jgi:hypothetical protein